MTTPTASSPDAAALRRTLDAIEALDLGRNLIELETIGYTRLEGVLDARTVERARGAIPERVQKLLGRPIDPEKATAEDFAGMTYLPYLLYDDVVFEEILLE